MTNLNKFLRILLIIALSAYQMKHIASVEGWETAIIIEVGIIIVSILGLKVPLVFLLLISSGYVLSFHFDGGFTMSIKAITEIVASFGIPFISAYVSGTKDETEAVTVPVTTETPMQVKRTPKPRQQDKTLPSEQVFQLRDTGHSIRQIAEQTIWSKGQVERILKQRVA